MKKYKIGLVIGRFQPFHKGHQYLIDRALEIAEKIVIAVGSSNVKNSNNPWSYQRRKKILEMFIEKEGITNKVISIVSLPDHPSDDVWLLKTLKKTGKIDVVIGNNDWVKGIFENVKTPVITINHYRRRTLEGYKIRRLMRKQKKWEERVPSYLISKIKKWLDFLE